MNKIDCIVCGRKGAGIPNQRILEGWCWGCIRGIGRKGEVITVMENPGRKKGIDFLR